MREGLIPHTVTTVMRLTTTESTARAVTELLGEIFDSDETGVAAFEDEASGDWLLDVYFAFPPDEESVRELIATAAGEEAAKAATFENVEAKDWVAQSLEGLKPVEAGRFLIHGAHDRAKAVKQTNRIRIEIEAALAFGTGHHGTTRGCLLAFDRLLKQKRPRRVLDVGTGTGVLAIAAARALNRRVVASDIDPIAIEVARANARFNAAAMNISWAVAPALRNPAITRGAPYDLVFANILAGPLKRMATEIAKALAPQGDLVLSGLLPKDAPGVLAVYGACGLALVSQGELEGWRALHLRRGGKGPRPRRSGDPGA
ncbi:50S ribosomal protein L11 methyltransferase [Terrarubrum flagellatum]|uniref:50S ribosomal protein L11 methyltransferase n=1 Tax=Terrirubrum flagellatum TaxID=2895980 RepID=UPI003144D3EC